MKPRLRQMRSLACNKLATAQENNTTKIFINKSSQHLLQASNRLEMRRPKIQNHLEKYMYRSTITPTSSRQLRLLTQNFLKIAMIINVGEFQIYIVLGSKISEAQLIICGYDKIDICYEISSSPQIRSYLTK